MSSDTQNSREQIDEKSRESSLYDEKDHGPKSDARKMAKKIAKSLSDKYLSDKRNKKQQSG